MRNGPPMGGRTNRFTAYAKRRTDSPYDRRNVKDVRGRAGISNRKISSASLKLRGDGTTHKIVFVTAISGAEKIEESGENVKFQLHDVITKFDARVSEMDVLFVKDGQLLKGQ